MAERVKHGPADLAVFGGTPEFDSPLHVGRPNVPDPERVLKRIAGALESRRLTNFGPLVREFEQAVAEVAGTRHCVATSNATAALQVLVAALGLRGEVIVPSFTYVATAHVLTWAGITPVFCDIDPDTGNLDPAEARRLVTPATSGILGVHVWGRQCAVESLRELAGEHGLALLYDAAHAFGCGYRGRGIGTFGDGAVFSFHATKFVNAFEGGAIVTDDDALADRVRALHFFGFDSDNHVIGAGINAKMSEASGAMGLTSLEAMSTVRRINAEHAERYVAELADVPGILVGTPGPNEWNSHHFVVLEVDADEAGLDRNRLAAALLAENVLTRRHFDPPCHRVEPYRSAPDRHVRRPLTRTDLVAGRIMQLPTGTGVTGDEVGRICRLIRMLVEAAPLL
ncbi:aminotransferase class I/II-fold pyridoxal phosphate-dependent enzyme [Amycolatopsis samaneae]|uniref:Aminotransferase class I/II-fold pyridoxal phosphate-dependent enzyme n=1 Tax=Amycolatopsis samaneae TaxID=664691 RepID=A0ABW5GP84_9PSEU